MLVYIDDEVMMSSTPPVLPVRGPDLGRVYAVFGLRAKRMSSSKAYLAWHRDVSFLLSIESCLGLCSEVREGGWIVRFDFIFFNLS